MSKPKVSQLIAQWEQVSFKETPPVSKASGQPLPSVQSMFSSSERTARRERTEPSAPPLDLLPMSEPRRMSRRANPSSSSNPSASAPAKAKASSVAAPRKPFADVSALNTMTPKESAEDLIRRIKEAPSSAPARAFSDQDFVTPKQYTTRTYENFLSADIARTRKTLQAVKNSTSPIKKSGARGDRERLSVSRSVKEKPFPEFSISAIPIAESFDVPAIEDLRQQKENSPIQANQQQTRESPGLVPPSTSKRKKSGVVDVPNSIAEESSRVMDESEVYKDNIPSEEAAAAGKKSRNQKVHQKRTENESVLNEQSGMHQHKVVVPASKRKCRDVICFVALLITWVGLITVGIIAIKIGNVEALLHATDFQGRICGSCDMNDDGHEATCGKPYQVVDPNRITEVFAVCVESCPKANETICPSSVDSQVGDQCWRTFVDQRALFYRCVPLAQSNHTCLRSPYLEFVNESLPVSADDPLCGTCLDPVFEPDGVRPKNPSAIDCKAKHVEVSTIRQYERLHPAVELFSSWSEIVVHWLADLQHSWQAIAVGGGCGALVGSIIWILLFACFAGTVVWLTLFSVVIGSAFISFELLYAGGVVSKAQVADALEGLTFIDNPEALASVQIFVVSDSAQMETYAIAGWILTVVTLILFLLACSLQRNVIRAAAIMRGASRAILFNCTLWIMPFLSFALVMAVFAWWAFVTALLGSAGRIAPASFVLSLTGTNISSDGVSMRADDWVDVNPAMIVFHTFACLWTIFFVRALCAMAIAAVVASWRFKERRRLSVCGALRLIARYHLGTAALGSAIIAMLQLLRLILSYIDRKARQVSVGKQNALSRAFLAVATCLLSCFSSFLKFATRFSYVIAAIRGESFCLATKSAFVLLSSNLVDSGVSLFLSGAVLLLGRLLVVGFSATITWFLIWYQIMPVSALSSYFAPVASAILLAWFISGACFDLYAASLDTLIICKLEQKARGIKRSDINATHQEISTV